MIQHIDEAYKPILDREASIDMAEKFSDAVELLHELIDYGTSLIPRAYVDSARDLKAICSVFVQLRQFITHLDGISVLLTAGACGTANLQLRSLLETAHTIEWILASDTESKLRHLYVAISLFDHRAIRMSAALLFNCRCRILSSFPMSEYDPTELVTLLRFNPRVW